MEFDYIYIKNDFCFLNLNLITMILEYIDLIANFIILIIIIIAIPVGIMRLSLL
jgi:hypothetical protein